MAIYGIVTKMRNLVTKRFKKEIKWVKFLWFIRHFA